MTVGPYEGLHAFAFLHGTDPGRSMPDVVDALRDLGGPPDGPVLFAAEFVGPWSGFAHVAVETGDLAGLQALIRGPLWEAGVRSEWAIEARVHRNDLFRPLGPKRASPPACALSRIWVAPGAAEDVLARLGAELGDAFQGASIVFGAFDILLEVGANDLDTVGDVLLERVHRVVGVVRSETAFAWVPPSPAQSGQEPSGAATS